MEGFEVFRATSESHSFPPPIISGLSKWQRVGIGLFLAGFIVFGPLVELRSAFLKRRMTDLGVYLRAAWAVRSGDDLYTITEENGWHYHYLPLFAIVMTPLADP